MLGATLERGVASAAPVAPYPQITLPSRPHGHWSYVTRPDLTPPRLSISTTPGFPYSSEQPKYIFCAPRSDLGGPYPAGAGQGPLITTLTGEVVWFNPIPASEGGPFNFRVQTYQSNPSAKKTSVLTWFQGKFSDIGISSSGNGVILKDDYSQMATVEAGPYQIDLHELLLTDQGTAMVAAYVPNVKVSGGTIYVGHAVEVDISSGEVKWDWPCYPHVSRSDSMVSTTGDYFHLNSIDIWPGSPRNVLVSGRNVSTVYLIDRLTNKILWRVGGGKRSTFKMGTNSPFYFQHDARALADGSGISVFDDASQPSPEKNSSGKVITLDPSNKTATLRHQYFHTDRATDTPREGNVQLLPNGGHVVGWGSTPYMSELRASGNAMNAELILDARFPANVESYRWFMFDWSANPPQSELRAVVRPTGGSGHYTAWVSWNGATKVAAWRLSAGPSSHSMEVITTVAKHSFETAINFTRNGTQAVRIAALDAAGRVLTRTSVISPS
ncbi:MAG TPA: arylsulfotransferase family protein [Acidimicrobiales bacterium]|nr:arylsulfotransferase family protein [Acidimicrobiales bacterium]